MSQAFVIEPDRGHEVPAFSRKIIVVSALVYPLWHLATPSGATDPWWVWWAIGSIFLSVDWASRHVPFVTRNATRFIYLCAWLCTLQLYVLAFANDMQTFYVVGSVMAVLATSAFIRSKSDHAAFGVFVFVLSAVLLALDPEGRKAAYWGGMLTIVAASYYRLSVQVAATELTLQHQEELEEAVKERTAELSSANFRLRREMENRGRLEEELRVSHRLEAVGRLAGGIAHEFNNLLTRIRLYSEFARDKAPVDSSMRNDIEEIERAGHQAAALTRQLLSFSRGFEEQTEVLDLNGVIEDSHTMLRHLLGENAEFACLLGDGPHCICTDRGQLEQALVNLVLNARDAMTEGGRLTIETSVVSRQDARTGDLPEALTESEYVLLAVSDTGIGMDSETRARAFDPFFTRKPVNAGTGLGLSIVYGIVKRAGGYVRVLSEPGKGARFELFWPRADDVEVPKDELRSTAVARGHGERILLVEDQGEVRQALRQLLSKLGYRVFDAEDPVAAVRIADQTDEPIHLLLTDVVMPVMNGVKLAEVIRAKRPDTQVLLISGHIDADDSSEPAFPPGFDFLAKPFASEELAAKVRAILDDGVAEGTDAPERDA